MALLKLQNIGKIYVSEGNVTVGIRGVELSFERGEFVAVTGKSGSGKSTLLNVISGMDSYEEGELLIEGAPTSHYLQPDWEDYRRDCISFIFQDYNIIESYTVLQNVELALLHIDDRRLRRTRALELIDRVGLTDHLHHKGSRLSGGQKQRTVIARALAKDSPIILADEPTGNLDSVSAAEIIELLRSVSEHKLVIVVTHSFEELEGVATRHIRIHDGQVVEDRALSAAAPDADTSPVSLPPIPTRAERRAAHRRRRRRDLSGGVLLGLSIFGSRPKLSFFICLLLVAGMMGLFIITSICADAAYLFEDELMFTPIDGRLVLTRRDGALFSEGELASIAAETGARDYLHGDLLLDTAQQVYLDFDPSAETESSGLDLGWIAVSCIPSSDKLSVGRAPTAPNEGLLRLPYYYIKQLGGLEEGLCAYINGLCINIVGVSYSYDNTEPPSLELTHEGLRMATAGFLFSSDYSSMMSLRAILDTYLPYGVLAGHDEMELESISPTFEITDDSVYIANGDYRNLLRYYKGLYPDSAIETTLLLTLPLNENTAFDPNANPLQQTSAYTVRFTNDLFTDTAPTMPPLEYGMDRYLNTSSTGMAIYTPCVFIGAEQLAELADGLLALSYRQASLFFDSDGAAEAAAARLNDMGYIALTGEATYVAEPMLTVLMSVAAALMAVVWLCTVIFLAFFIGLCTSRTLAAFSGEMAIMRSMGISVGTIRVGMYVRMLISVIPALLALAAVPAIIYTSPTGNGLFPFLHWPEYLLIVAGMLLMVVLVTRRQVAKLFGAYVKGALIGGDNL